MNDNNSLLLQSPSTYEQPILKTMPLREQPAYRITQNANACNITELMAAVIGGQKQIELSQALLARFDGDIRRLYQAHPSELAKVKGINQATAIRIKAALNLGLRLSMLEKEHLRTILLDRRNRVLEIVEVYQGSVNSSQVRVGEVFQAAISRHASALILIHNHPSGDPTPSPDDVAVTRAIVQAGKLLDIDLLDHLVIGQGKWVSLKERGLGFN